MSSLEICHWCDLVAFAVSSCNVRPVSILDILPTRLASVYTFYNPDYRHMEWGKYTALREIYWTQQVRQWGTGRAVFVQFPWSSGL